MKIRVNTAGGVRYTNTEVNEMPVSGMSTVGAILTHGGLPESYWPVGEGGKGERTTQILFLKVTFLIVSGWNRTGSSLFCVKTS